MLKNRKMFILNALKINFIFYLSDFFKFINSNCAQRYCLPHLSANQHWHNLTYDAIANYMMINDRTLYYKFNYLSSVRSSSPPTSKTSSFSSLFLVIISLCLTAIRAIGVTLHGWCKAYSTPRFCIIAKFTFLWFMSLAILHRAF